ncbi:hypothetical protein [Leptospira interrogans]|uniref:ASCH domain-containing protein n=3 Tax=Leptospira interrogans TaxID=173 RepID=A0AAP9WB97_LEPIR|nr:hypothetical protein [Leptospira interrogans]EKO25279.1 hypothetical protein LEP1GSC104_3531 [Leptospira interrogans str. UI 12621]EKO89680.1 hypothetical protein LEP1GSC009_1295 [Leptospira interrogans serovar Grippotyphosa str. Andaman]EKP84236.1 hypothetical protein LEP1GSC020_4189 [Leptospira interrogans serovar Grippotyphosa str. 2006006986]EKR29172.1 hypothetical protein LEP1GSC087_2549 [Leptospira interrogans serovar Bataviae str. L1111]EKR55507.1 hypothetical protein LEP1GSC105_2190
MKIISFANTSPAFIAKEKSVTRRNWKDDYAKRFKKNELIQGWNRSPRFKGKPIGIIRLIETPYQENTFLMPEDDYAKEGFKYLDQSPHLKTGSYKDKNLKKFFEEWKQSAVLLWVVRFEYVEVFK